MVLINCVVGKLDDTVAHVVEEVPIVGDEQQCDTASRKVAFEPLNHADVEVVGRLVENEKLRIVDEELCKSHTLHLSARQFAGLLAEINDFQLG